MPYTFDEAVKVMKAGYKVARPGMTDGCSLELLEGDLVLNFNGTDVTSYAANGEDILADDWFTVNPPHITGELHMVLDSAVMS